VRATSAILFSGAGLGSQLGTGAQSGPVPSAAGGIQLVRGDLAIRQSIMLLLTTVPGERVMRPDYGCPLNRLIFWPNDATTAGLAIHYVRQAIRRFEPRVRIVRLDAGANPRDPAALLITLEYRVRETGTIDTIDASIELQAGAG
jgi:phage baseplate assembly protein W